MKRGFLTAVVGAAFLGLVNGGGVPVNAQLPDALTFFKNYFITGDYVVGGVGLEGRGVNGVAQGDISIAGVPDGADILAAYLYWQVVATDNAGPDAGSAGATFNGHALTNSAGPIAKVLGQSGTAPCWASGGGTGTGSAKRTFTYRADVLRFLNIDENASSPTFGKHLANGAHTVTLPDSGSGNAVPLALGASLVVVYRDSTKPLGAVVIYDGSYTINNAVPRLSQTIEGFYQPAAIPNARITYIAGSGQSNKYENVYFDPGSSATTLLAANPFTSSTGASWDNPTFNVNPGTAAQVTTAVDTTGLGASDCLTWGAIVFKTDVQDSDDDGLLDVWELSTAASPVIDPSGKALPPLGDMGARTDRKDVFIEIGYMTTNGADLLYGGAPQPAHDHLPSHEALKLIGDAFDTAPVSNPGPSGIAVHFDVGSAYPFGTADAYVVRRDLARGGEAAPEAPATPCVRLPTDPPWACQFSAYPGTVGWKTGFRYLRDEVLGGAAAPLPGEEDICDLPDAADGPGQPCERRFDRTRKDIFHYAFFAHALGLPKAEKPCLDSLGQPASVNATTLQCDVAEEPLFKVPKTSTGVGDFPGGDALITLGGFPDLDGRPTGTPFMQASTLMHEMGHNFERRHSGEESTAAVPNPNCKPTYLSVMNYLYQLRGLLDDAGRPHLDYSRGIGPELNEQALWDGVPTGSPYRLGWYAPLGASYLAGRASGAGRHCDGSGLSPTDVPMVRLDARFAADGIDWEGNGPGIYTLPVGPFGLTLDVNFNGRTTVMADGSGGGESLRGSDDWSNLRLNQIGSRRNVGGYYDNEGFLQIGPMSLDMGRLDFGRLDFGRLDFGRLDFGRLDFGTGDVGLGDFGRLDFGRLDFGRLDFGRLDFGRLDFGAGDLARGGFAGGGDLFQGDPNNAAGEIDFETAGDLAKTPPNEFTACVIGVGGCAAPPGSAGSAHDVVATLRAPNVGGVSSYIVYRVAGDTLVPGQTWTPVTGPVSPLPGQSGVYYVVDSSSLTNGALYTFFAVALYADGIQSDPSNLVTITAVNTAPAVSSIPDQTISMNSDTGPISFTISDERVGSVTLSGSSSNTALVPTANIVFGGSGATRTVTVTPALNQSGTATITVTATDSTGGTSSDAFVLTVQPLAVFYTFTGFLSPLVAAGTEAAPSSAGVLNFGKAIPIKWQLRLGDVLLTDLSTLRSLEAVPGQSATPLCTPNGVAPVQLLDPLTGRPTGNSTYRIGSGQFIFNWDTTATNQTYCYRLRLTLNDGSAPNVTIVRFK